jgi:hypothetical protein
MQKDNWDMEAVLISINQMIVMHIFYPKLKNYVTVKKNVQLKNMKVSGKEFIIIVVKMNLNIWL